MEFAPETELDATRRQLTELQREVADLRARMGFPIAGSPEDLALQFAAIVESSDDAIFSLDLDGAVRSWNRGAERIFGYMTFEALGHSTTAAELLGGSAAVRDTLARVQRGDVEKREASLRRKDGSLATVWLTVSPVRSQSGELVAAAFIARDLAESKQREAESETLLSNLPDVVSRFDRSLRFIYVSPAVQRLTGSPPQSFLGKTYEEAGIPRRQAEQLGASLRRIFETGQPDRVEFDFESPTMGSRRLHAVGVPEFGSDGRVMTALSIVRDATERIAAEAALSDTQRQLEALFEQASDAIVVADESARLIRWNPAACALLGYSREEMGRLRLFELLPRVDTARVEAALADLRAGRARVAEWNVVRKDGSLVAAEVSAKFVPGVGYQAFARDITERRRSQQALAAAEERLRVAADAGNVGLWDWDIRADKIVWSDRIYELHGVKPGQFGGSVADFAGLLHPDDAPRVQAALQDSLQRGARYEIEFRALHPDTGAVRWLSTTAEVLRDKTGNPVRMLGAVMDISGRKELERAIEERTQNLTATLESITDGLMVIDRDWKLRYVNPAGERMFSRTSADLIGKDFWEDFPGQSEETQAIYRRVMAEQQLAMFESAYEPSQRWFDVRVYPMAERGISVYFQDVTARKQAELDARRLHTQLEAIVNGSPLPIIALTTRGDITLWNPAAERLFGWASEEVIGKPIPFIPKEKLAEHRKMRERDLSGDNLTGLEVTRRRKDGTPIDISVSTAALRDSDGRITGIMSLYEDITERKRAEQALRESERSFRRFVETAPIGVAFGGFDGFLRYANEQYLKTVGYTREELERGDLKWSELTPPEYRDLDEQAAAEVRERGACTPYEKELIRKDGSRVPVLIGASLPAEPWSVQKTIYTFCLDLSAQQEARRAVEDKIRDFEALLSVTPVGIVFAADAECRNVQVNPAFAAWAGISAGDNASLADGPEQMSNVPYRFVQDGRELTRDEMPLRVCIADNTDIDFELDIVRTDGATFSVYGYSTPIRNAAGQPRGGVAAFVDITERKSMEEVLRQVNEELRRANADLEQFAYAAAHDLQEPLRNVAIYSQMVARRYEDQIDEEGREYLSLCTQGAKRMQALVQDLLAFTTALGVPARTVITDCRAIVHQVQESLATAISESGAIITYGELPRVRVPATQLAQVFSNVIGNAIKYRFAQPPVIEVRAEAVEGGMWRISVHDNGLGIRREYTQQIFGVFKRLHGREIPGTGIGLAICKRVVEHHGGQIWAESEGEGKGSTFMFTLPGAEGG